MIAQAVLALALTMPAASFRTAAAAAEAVAAGGDDAEAALRYLKAKGQRGLWAVNDVQKKKRGKERGRLLESMGWFRLAECEWTLRKGLKLKDVEAKAGAIRGMAHMRSDKLIKPILRTAGHASGVVRGAVAEALIEIGSKMDLKVWDLITGSDANAKITGYTYLALRKSDRLSDRAIPLGLEDSSKNVRLAAVALAGARGSDLHAPALEKLARSSDEALAVAAVDALAAMWTNSTPRRLAKIVAEPGVIEPVWRKTFALLRAKGKAGFAGLTDGIAAAPAARQKALADAYVASITDEELQRALDLLAHPRPQQRALGDTILSGVGEKAEDAAIARLAGADLLVRRAVTRYLKGQPRDRVGPKLLAAAEQGDPAVRAGAIGVLASIGGKQNRLGLMPMLSDPAPEVRAAAARALGKVKSPEVEQALEKALGDPEASVRMAALEGLAKRKNRSRSMAMLGALDDVDAKVRLSAIKKLSGPKDVKVLRALEGRLRTGPEKERTAIVKAIADSMLPEAAALMVSLVTDQDRNVRRAALKVIEEQ